ncbi:MAG TPA: sigma-70 family RNA polymerase sigma factor [Herpetosiphonaceae bacterium]
MDELTAAPSSSIDDATLLSLLRERSPQGLALLYDRYGRLIYSTALRIVRDHGVAEEVTQDVFLRCWNNIGSYQPAQGTLVSWLVGIAHHRAIDELRSRRGKNRSREVSTEYLLYLPAPHASFDEALLREEIRAALEGLPAAQREAIEIIFWQGFSRREAADQLGVPIGTLHTRLRLGMEKLRAIYERLFHDDP